MNRPCFVALALASLLGGCIELKVLPPHTVRSPQPRPACGDTGRAYAPPAPGPVSAPPAPTLAANGGGR